MTPAQCRMARGALDWTVRDLAAKAEVGVNTVTRFEKGADTLASTIFKLQRALEAAGVEFIPENGGGAGVRLRKALGYEDGSVGEVREDASKQATPHKP